MAGYQMVALTVFSGNILFALPLGFIIGIPMEFCQVAARKLLSFPRLGGSEIKTHGRGLLQVSASLPIRYHFSII